ncbi:tRNA-(ms[2]io[6]A)-hydroxylase [Candidatus Amoebophilus asiaticus]|nr:tRNA-(ms[2]io[6]A)-hydroxylase [Candidatus Amoebophilus asiaticus]
MKISVELACDTDPKWVDVVLDNIPEFLQDHADCERKASAMALTFVAKYPDRAEIIPELIEIAIEELEHFQSVYEIMEKRGIKLKNDMPRDPYVNQLLSLCRTGREERFLDRLLVASVVECRGAERFKLLYRNVNDDEELKDFYHDLWASEAKHGNIFVKMALNYFDRDAVYGRLAYFVEEEAIILNQLEFRPAFH